MPQTANYFGFTLILPFKILLETKICVQFRITCHNNKTLFWHVANTHTVFSLMTGLHHVMTIKQL